MANRNLQLKVKAINQRYVDLVKTFGIESEPVRQYQEIINTISTIGVTKSGNIAIKQVSKLTERDIKKVNKLYHYDTKSGYVTKYKQSIVADYIDANPDDTTLKDIDEYEKQQGKISTDALTEVANLMKNLHELITTKSDMIYNADREITNHLRQTGGRNHLSLSEVKKVIDIVNGDVVTYEQQWDALHRPSDEIINDPELTAEYYAWSSAYGEYRDTGRDIYAEKYQEALELGYNPYNPFKRG